MKIPAIRAKIGIWVYYVATLTFKQVEENVKRVDDELHKSELLKEMLQRNITNNYKSIANYIEKQQERFFNALVLAVYDGDPQWHEIRLEDDKGEEFYDLGILELTGKEKIFPVDGQHRVEGIRKIVGSSAEYNNEKIAVIFIGHKKDDEGMQRTRRMFSTLNRYAKPVSMRDIIALDEDDIVAIASRDLIDNSPLFSNCRIFDSKTKAIPETNKAAFTTLITFYECNLEILWMTIKGKKVIDSQGRTIRGRGKLKEYVRIRPKEEEIEEFIRLCNEFWQILLNSTKEISDYSANTKMPTGTLRSKAGGSLLFRPVSLIPYVKTIIKICNFEKSSFDEAVSQYPKQILQLTNPIWKNVLWNSDKGTMITNNKSTVEYALAYMFNEKILSEAEKSKLYAEIQRINNLADEKAVIEYLQKGLI